MAFDPDKYLEEKSGGFDPDAYLAEKAGPEPQKQPEAPEEPQKTMFGLNKSIERSLFPNASKMPREGFVSEAKKGGLGALELLGAPTRAIGALRGYSMSDPESALLRPEMNKLKSMIDKAQPNASKEVPTSPLEYGQGMQVSQSSGKEALKGTIELGGNILSDPTLAFGLTKKIVLKGAKQLNRLAGKISQELSGVPEQSLRAYGAGLGKNAKAIRSASGTQMKIANEMLDAIDDFDNYLPERIIIDKSLKNMPPINSNNLITTLKGSMVQNPVTSGAKAANRKIRVLINNISKEFKGGKIPAEKFRKLRLQFDNELKSAFDKDYKDYIEGAMTKSRNTMKTDLIDAANASGKPEYIDAMKLYSEKLDAVERLKGYVGKNTETRNRRIESFVSNLFGKNSENKQQVVKEIGDLFGHDFLKQSKLARIASDLGEGGVPSWLPRQTTGRSTMGGVAGAGQIATGIATGNPALVATGTGTLALSSPRVSAAILGGMDEAGNLSAKAGSAINKIPGSVVGAPAAASTAGEIIKRFNEKKKELAIQAIEDPDATEEEKAQAKKILGL